MQLKVTANYPTDEVRKIVMFAARFCEIDHAGLAIKVKNHRGSFAGMAYDGVCTSKDVARGAVRLVTLRIGNVDRFPMVHKGMRLVTWQDALVYLAGHEFGHIYQFQHPKVKRGEKIADWYGIRTLEAWRKAKEN